MCGRFARFSPAHVFQMLFQLDQFPNLPPQYNISPGQDIFAIRGILIREDYINNAFQNNLRKEVAPLKWGLIPFWSKDPIFGNKMINSRAETIMEKPSFKEVFKNRRCLIPTDGFFEWQKTNHGSKQPYFIHMKNKDPFALAGIWDKWKSPEGRSIESCSILTITPNEVVKHIHNRMPVIIDPKEFDVWLDISNENTDQIKALLKPYNSTKMDAYPVSPYINKPENKGEECIKKLDDRFKQKQLLL